MPYDALVGALVAAILPQGAAAAGLIRSAN